MNEMIKQSENQFQTDSQHRKNSTLQQLPNADRPKPNLLRINADNQDKKFMCIFWSIFLVFVITLAIVSKTLPKAVKLISNDTELAGTSLQQCQNPSVSQDGMVVCSSFSQNSPTVGIVVKQLSSLNQFVTFWLEVYPKDVTSSMVIDQNLTYLIYGLDKVDNGFRMRDVHQNETVPFQFSSQSASYLYANDKTVKGYRVFIGFIGEFASANLLFTLQFKGPFEQLANIAQLKINAFKIGKSFTIFTIILRYVFFVMSLLAAFLYNRRYRKIAINDRIIEQKLIEILSVLVVFFNDPFYPITILKENMVSSFFSMLFVLVFVVYLVFMWMVFFDRILYEEGQKGTQQITKFKIIYCTVLLILLMTLYMLYASYRLNDHPLIPSQSLTDTRIILLDIITSVFFAAAILYIGTQYVRICCDKSDRLWRSELMMSYSVLFIVAMMVFVFTDNALGSYHYEGANFIFLYGLMNFYVWYLQFMYSPAGEDGEEKMINDNEMMSIGTVEFNDLNINLDENEGWAGGKSNELLARGNERKKDRSWGRAISKQEGSQQEQQHQQRQFSIEDNNEQPQQNSNQPKSHHPHNEQIDFFNQQAINHLISQQPTNPQPNQTNLLQLSTNNPTKNPSLSLEPSEQVDQNELEILSETVSQRPDQNEIREKYDALGSQVLDNRQTEKKEDGFGDFELE